MRLAIDIGSTFINCILINGQACRALKIFSSAHALEKNILNIIHEFELLDDFERGNLIIIHNSDDITRLFAFKNNSGFTFIKENKLLAAPFLNQLINTPASLIFNMGGNTANSYLIKNNTPNDEKFIPVGGESIAFLDDQQVLQIGSLSTDSTHLSACYGLGGDLPTITDANLMLGRLRPDTILGNAIRPDVNAARMALAKLAGALNIRIEEAALAIINAANQKITGALQALLNKNHIRDTPLTLCAGGGCAGLHVCAVADALNIKNVIIPLCSGAFSATQLLLASDPALVLPDITYSKTRASHYRIQLYGISLPVGVWQRHELSPEEMIMGPAIIIENTSTLFLQNGWLAYVDVTGHLFLRRMAIDVN